MCGWDYSVQKRGLNFLGALEYFGEEGAYMEGMGLHFNESETRSLACEIKVLTEGLTWELGRKQTWAKEHINRTEISVNDVNNTKISNKW